MTKQYQIQCPSCDHEFNVEDAIASKVKAGYSQSIKEIEGKLKEEFKSKVEKLGEREAKLEEAEAHQEEIISRKLSEAEAARRSKIEEELSSQYETKLKALQEENEAGRKKVKDLQQKELELLTKEREVYEAKEAMELDFQRKLNKERELIKAQLAKGFEERKAIDIEEKDILIQQLKDRIDDMKKKADQGSMQLQGEAQELVLESMLKEKFPFDLIEEVPKGVAGADCIQVVRNEFGKECGSIVYESKRTKNFSAAWLPKLKQDTLAVKGKIPVLVTEALPEGVAGIGQIDGVWVCDFPNFPILAMTLRFAIVREFQALDHQENKGDKMQMLYDYLTSEEFRMQMTTIIEGFTAMKDGLTKQRKSMMAHWKKQEKEIDRVVESTVNMYGSVRGIGGSAIQEIQQLEIGE